MQIQKPPLFSDNKTLVRAVLLLCFITLLRLFITYQEYRTFISKPFYYTYANVTSEKIKKSKGRSYKVLKLHTDDGLNLITTAYTEQSYHNKRVRLQLFPDEKISFKGYLSSFYVKSRITEVEPLHQGFKESLLEKVASQHQTEQIASFYNAIFFATPLHSDLREQIAKLGISHLVALSGFHLGILWGLVYGLLVFFYRLVQQRYFPYRYALIDIGVVTLTVLAVYLWFVGSPPSLVRSFAMVLTGWVVLVLGMELVSFSFLVIVVFTLLALIPSLIVSLGFWLSVAGVFAIFLLLKYTQGMDKRIVGLLVIPVGIFILMLPVVHSIFAVTTAYQLFSPVLSLLFIPFYPLVMLLHLLGYGSVFDEILIWLFTLPDEASMHTLPMNMMLGYIALALLSIRYQRAFVMLSMLAMMYAIFLFAV